MFRRKNSSKHPSTFSLTSECLCLGIENLTLYCFFGSFFYQGGLYSVFFSSCFTNAFASALGSVGYRGIIFSSPKDRADNENPGCST